MKNFALVGAGGYIAPRHMKAIRETGNTLAAALDIHDSVGILDSYFPAADFFTSFERFDRHLEKLKRAGNQVDYLSVCTPNHVHDAHTRFGLRSGIDVICEKPVALNTRNIEALMDIERETGKQVFTILQLRLHPEIIRLKEKVDLALPGRRFSVDLQYITSRGSWYHHSWKGDIEKSGGIATNIGIHFFDMLIWIFGEVEQSELISQNAQTAEGNLVLKKANVHWKLSIDQQQLPVKPASLGQTVYRMLDIDGESIEFSDGFADLHTASYAEILAGRGFTLKETLAATALVEQLRKLV